MSTVGLALRASVLRHRNFRLLVTGASVSSFGSAMTPVALAFAVLGLGGSATQLGIVEAVFAACQVLTALLGGVLGDRVARQLMMEGSSAASALVECGMTALLVTHAATIPLLTVFGAVTGVMSALSRPSSAAMTRAVVPSDDLARAVALRPLLQTTATTIGYAIAGVLVEAIGSGWAIAVDAATFAFAAAAYSRLKVDSAPAPGGSSVLADLGDGFREVKRHTWLWLLIAQALVYHLFFYGAQGVLGPIVVGEGISKAAWGAALAAQTTGFAAGGLLCLRWRPRRSLASGVACLTLTALFPLAMALFRSIWPVLAGAFINGVGLQAFSVFWDLSIQQNIAEDKLARVYSLDTAGSFVASPVGLALTGPVAAAAGFRTWLIVVACVAGGSSLITLASSDVRHLERV